MITRIEVPNVDDHSVDPKELSELGEEFREISQIFSTLAYVTSLKKEAMRFRSHGHVALAFDYERSIERIYKNLPKWAQW